MKTTNDILTDIFQVVTNSPISALNGDIYKKIRPTDSRLEDCIINLINGTGAKFLQDGALYIKIFYNDINQDNTFYEDATNGSAKELLLWNLSDVLLKSVDYSFDIQSRELYTEAVPETHQHYAILKINFEVTIN